MRRDACLGRSFEPSKPAAALLQARLRALHRALDRDLRDLARVQDPEAVHRVRVDARRLRALLRAFAPVLDPGRARRYERGLRDLAAELDAARDAEVALANFGTLAPSASAARARLGAESRRARRALSRRMQSRAWRERLRGLRRIAAEEALVATAPRRLDRLLARTIVQERRRAARALERRPHRAHALHRLRIALKRMRYVADECFGDTPEEAAEIEGLRALQDSLGEWHDARRLRAVLRAQVPQGPRRWRKRLRERERRMLARYRRRRRRLLDLWRALA
ncbi:MAG: CHAD domain-containing protein [Gammaproteobacteria bacterium]|nr:CHAD domain-containing protein [Gammaproteobacteria bacterium]